MTTASASPDPFEQVRDHYAALCRTSTIHFNGPPAGRLLLAPPLSQGGAEWLIAGSIAGAASLSADSEIATARAALRNGSLDFSVTQLDEALRILKNEIRKQQPVSVCVERSPVQVLGEMVERGAQPDLIAPLSGYPHEHIQVLFARGAISVDTSICGAPMLEALTNPGFAPELSLGTAEVRWSSTEASGASALRTLSTLDALVTSLIPADDWQRQRWLRFAPRYLPRPLRTRRALPMRSVEAAGFESAIREKLGAGEFTEAVELKLGNDVPILLRPKQ